MERGPVVCLGELLVVLCPEGPDDLKAATLLRRSIGGAEANVARMLAALGVPVDLVTRLGADPWGSARTTDCAEPASAPATRARLCRSGTHVD